MDGMKGNYITRNYECTHCKRNVQVTHIVERPLGDPDTYEVYCPKCKTHLADIPYTKGDAPRMVG